MPATRCSGCSTWASAWFRVRAGRRATAIAIAARSAASPVLVRSARSCDGARCRCGLTRRAAGELVSRSSASCSPAAAATCKRSSTQSRPAQLDARIAVVVSNRADAAAWNARARPVSRRSSLDHRSFADARRLRPRARRELGARDVDARLPRGFHAAVGAGFSMRFPTRILNIHPSLLPAFPGRRRAAAGARARRQGHRRYGALRTPSSTPARSPPGRRAGARRRHRRDALGAHSRRGAPHLPRGGEDPSRGRLAGRGSRFTAG